jgi:hypothetical protein
MLSARTVASRCVKFGSLKEGPHPWELLLVMPHFKTSRVLFSRPCGREVQLWAEQFRFDRT